MDQMFSDIPCESVVDDILVSGVSQKEHDKKLIQVLKNRAREVNLNLKLKKFKFRASVMVLLREFPSHMIPVHEDRCKTEIP